MSDSFVTSWTIVCQAPLSMGFPRQEYWSGCHFPLQWIFLTQELNGINVTKGQVHIKHSVMVTLWKGGPESINFSKLDFS